MADEVTAAAGAAGELVAAEIVSRLVIDAAYAEAVMPSLVRIEDISEEATLTAEFVKWPLLSASDATDGTDLSNTAVNTTGTTVAADEAGIMITVTDMLTTGSKRNLLEFAEQLGKALANKIDTDLLAEVADFSNSIGSSGVNITHADFLTAIYTLENGVAAAPFVSVFHPIQIADLRTSLTTSGLATWNAVDNQGIGAMAELFGVPIVQSTNCASVNTNADRQGVMMPLGMNSGLAYVLKVGAKSELQRDASLRATEIVTTAIYGDECVNTAANGGVKIITDHE